LSKRTPPSTKLRAGPSTKLGADEWSGGKAPRCWDLPGRPWWLVPWLKSWSNDAERRGEHSDAERRNEKRPLATPLRRQRRHFPHKVEEYQALALVLVHT
jgi:hypothetical protein